MMNLKLACAAAILSTAMVTPSMAQEATQEPGMIGFNYPNSNYLTGGYGVSTPNRWYALRVPDRWYRSSYAYAPGAYDSGPVGPATGVVVGAVGTAGAIASAPFRGYDAYAYYDGGPQHSRHWGKEASEQGAPTSAAVNSHGSRTSPGAVKHGTYAFNNRARWGYY